jgi:hypothetical protein
MYKIQVQKKGQTKKLFLASGSQGALLKNRPLDPHKTFIKRDFCHFIFFVTFAAKIC